LALDRGTLLNKRYRITDVLGQGGMAALYRAIDENLGVEVAVKENLFTTDEYARQFRREAVILATLRHPNLPRVTDHFVIEGQGQYLVMDYIEGEDLRQRIDRLGVLGEDEAVVLGVAICEALIYLHNRQPSVVHRDVKPGNIKITPQGQVFLVDFGLAKVLQGKQLTETGARAMTPGYSPPEQYGAARTDHRTDIYALGATLYSVLTDHLPEDGMARAMDQAGLTPIRKYNPKISRRLEAVIEKALAVRPDDRYQSAVDFQSDLLNTRNTSKRRMQLDLKLTPPPNKNDVWPVDVAETDPEENGTFQGEGMAPPPIIPTGMPDRAMPQPQSRQSMVWVLLGLILLFIMAGAVILAVNPIASSRAMAFLPWVKTPTNLPVATPTPQAAAIQVKVSTRIILATIGRSATPSATPRPSITTMSSPVPSLTPTNIGGGLGPIAFASDRNGGVPQIWTMNTDGSSLRQLTQIPEGACQPRWSPDGTRLVFISPCKGDQDSFIHSSIFIMNADGSGLVSLSSNPGSGYDPAWAPDSQQVAYTAFGKEGIAQIFIYDLQTKQVKVLTDPELRANFQPAWSANHEIAYIGLGDQIWVMNEDGANRRLMMRNADLNLHNKTPRWSPDGKTLVFTRWNAGISGAPWLAVLQNSPDASAVNVAVGSPMAEADYSPDGYWLVYTGWPDSAYRHLYIITSKGVGRRQLTDLSANDFDPSWRPASPAF
jgi:serine/threonine protein kinase/Tol biopolymer transport system component